MLGANVWASRKALIAIGVLAIGGTGWCAVRDSGLDPSLGSSRPAETPPPDARSADARRIVLDFADCLDTAAETLASSGMGGASIYGCNLPVLVGRQQARRAGNGVRGERLSRCAGQGSVAGAGRGEPERMGSAPDGG